MVYYLKRVTERSVTCLCVVGLDIEEQIIELTAEGEVLKKKKSLLARHAEAPTMQMYAECQELLQMFGLPYIIAPMEVRTKEINTGIRNWEKKGNLT